MHHVAVGRVPPASRLGNQRRVDRQPLPVARPIVQRLPRHLRDVEPVRPDERPRHLRRERQHPRGSHRSRAAQRPAPPGRATPQRYRAVPAFRRGQESPLRRAPPKPVPPQHRPPNRRSTSPGPRPKRARATTTPNRRKRRTQRTPMRTTPDENGAPKRPADFAEWPHRNGRPVTALEAPTRCTRKNFLNALRLAVDPTLGVVGCGVFRHAVAERAGHLRRPHPRRCSASARTFGHVI